MKLKIAAVVSSGPGSPSQQLEQLAALDRVGQHSIVNDPDEADALLFPDAHLLFNDWRLRTITHDRLFREYRRKSLLYDERDRPWCAAPGIFVSMPAKELVNRVQKPWAYYRVPDYDNRLDPDLLFSFVASASHPCRNGLFRLNHSRGLVSETKRFTFYDASSEGYATKRDFFDETLVRSKFVLCPRGAGTSSIRLFETLAAGRVPVIISDDWAPPVGPDWNGFAIRWPQGSYRGLVERLEEAEERWEEMAEAAYATHRQWFAQDISFHRLAEICQSLIQSHAVEAVPEKGIRGAAYRGSRNHYMSGRLYGALRRTGGRLLRASKLRV